MYEGKEYFKNTMTDGLYDRNGIEDKNIIGCYDEKMNTVRFY